MTILSFDTSFHLGHVMRRAVFGVSYNKTRPRGYKTVFMLNLTEHEIYPAHKCHA